MKKILLSAAAFAMVAASAIAVAPNTAQAIPAFARQTGMACYACHFQSFPALAEFGRSFKRDAFTDVGSEALVEDDNLSIPAVLNAALALHAAYSNVDNNATTGTGGLPANKAAPGFKKGIWSLPIEAPLMLAGRVGKNVGAFVEFDGGSQPANGSPAANWQVMSSFDMGNFRMGLNAFDTSFGYTAGIETFNTFGQHDGVLNGGDVSAVVNIGNGNDAGPLGAGAVQTEGLTLWAGNDMWFAALTGWSPMPGAGASNIGFSLIPGIRVAVTPQVMGWDTEIGGGWTAGTVGATAVAATAGPNIVTPGYKVAGADLWFIDAQAQGSVGNTSVGVYADYAHTKAKTNVDYNVFGAQSMPDGLATAANTGKTDGFSIRATIKPIPQWVFEAGYGQTKYTPTTGQSTKLKIWQIGGQYELYQNFNLKLMYEDDKADVNYPTYTAPAGGGSQDVKVTTFELDALM